MWLTTTWFGNTVRDYLIAAGLFGLVALGLGALKAVLLQRLQALAARTKGVFDDLLVQLLQRHVGPVVFVWTALYLGTRSLVLPEGAQQILHSVFVVIVTVKTVQVAQAILAYLLMDWTRRTRANDPNAAVMVKNLTVILRILLWLAGTLFILDNLGINVTTFLAGLGIGGVAVALAAQAILGDAFSSFAIFLDKPFEVGDCIVVGDVMGTVESIGFKTTRLRSLDGEQLIVANSDLTGSRIRNFKRMAERRVVCSLNVAPETSLDQLKAIPELLRRIITEQSRTRFDRTHFQKYGDAALVFEVVYAILSADYNAYMDTQQAVNLRIFEEFQRTGIRLAYPARPVYVSEVKR